MNKILRGKGMLFTAKKKDKCYYFDCKTVA